MATINEQKQVQNTQYFNKKYIYTFRQHECTVDFQNKTHLRGKARTGGTSQPGKRSPSLTKRFVRQEKGGEQQQELHLTPSAQQQQQQPLSKQTLAPPEENHPAFAAQGQSECE